MNVADQFLIHYDPMLMQQLPPHAIDVLAKAVDIAFQRITRYGITCWLDLEILHTAAMGPCRREIAAVLSFDENNRALGFNIIGIGTLDAVDTPMREVLRPPICLGADRFIFSHNHPSGCAAPSERDQLHASELYFAARCANLNPLDSFIVGSIEIVSLRQLVLPGSPWEAAKHLHKRTARSVLAIPIALSAYEEGIYNEARTMLKEIAYRREIGQVFFKRAATMLCSAVDNIADWRVCMVVICANGLPLEVEILEPLDSGDGCFGFRCVRSVVRKDANSILLAIRVPGDWMADDDALMCSVISEGLSKVGARVLDTLLVGPSSSKWIMDQDFVDAPKTPKWLH